MKQIEIHCEQENVNIKSAYLLTTHMPKDGLYKLQSRAPLWFPHRKYVQSTSEFQNDFFAVIEQPLE